MGMLVRTVHSVAALGLSLVVMCLLAAQPVQAQSRTPHQPCVDYSDDPAGCQPSTFATPTGQLPSRRIGKDGKLDPKSSEAEARAGAALLERKLHLFRNIT